MGPEHKTAMLVSIPSVHSGSQLSTAQAAFLAAFPVYRKKQVANCFSGDCAGSDPKLTYINRNIPIYFNRLWLMLQEMHILLAFQVSTAPLNY